MKLEKCNPQSPYNLLRALFVLATVALTAALTATTAQATVIGGAVTGGYSAANGGTFVILDVPFTDSDPDNTVGSNNFQNLNLYAFDEGQNIVITVPVEVDRLADGLGGGSGSGTLAVGTIVASHYVFYDPAGTTARSQTGTVTFDSNILGIISSDGNLGDSDFLINNGVTYLDPNLRGLEAGDSATITGLSELTLNWAAGDPGDYVRVLTTFSPLPEPTTGMLMGLSTLALVLRERRSRA